MFLPATPSSLEGSLHAYLAYLALVALVQLARHSEMLFMHDWFFLTPAQLTLARFFTTSNPRPDFCVPSRTLVLLVKRTALVQRLKFQFICKPCLRAPTLQLVELVA